MSIRSTVTALSTALALTVMLTTASTPAFAAKPQPEQPKPPTTIDGPNPLQEATIRPDVRVVYVNSTASGDGRVYLFRVESRGPAIAHNIGLTSRVGHKRGTFTKYLYGNPSPISQLAPGQSQNVLVGCNPEPEFVCDIARLDAEVTNDLNPDDNWANSWAGW